MQKSIVIFYQIPFPAVQKLFLYLWKNIDYNLSEMFQGGVRFPTGSYSLRTFFKADQVKFLDRRYSPDGRNSYMFLTDCPDIFVRFF